ncbi:MAG: YciI family protein [Pseudomonadota bacterium]
MLFAITCLDKPGMLETRINNRANHLAYIDETCVVVQAGPFLDDAGEMYGSLIILDVEDLDAAQAWADGDPYARAGLFESVEIRVWKKVVG